MKESIVNFFHTPHDLQSKLSLSLIHHIFHGQPENAATEANQVLIAPIFGRPLPYRGDIYVIQSFSREFDEAYHRIEKVAASYYMETSRGQDIMSSNILVAIWSAIFGSKLVVADVSDANPNVMYELGIAHAIGKPTILITNNITGVPFLTRQHRIIALDDSFEVNFGEAISKLVSV